MATLDDLLNAIFDGEKPPLYADFEGWARDSRRFKAFATAYATKIRAKLKNARDEGGMQDLRAELNAAAILLRDERFTLEYERYAASKQRGPDFTATFKTNLLVNVEVRRMRGVELEAASDDAWIGKLSAVLCDKVGQMPPSIVNLLWMTGERAVSESDIARAVIALRQLAERKDEVFFTRRGFANAAEFLRQYRHLSGIVLHQPNTIGTWLNPLARHTAPPELVNAIRRL